MKASAIVFGSVVSAAFTSLIGTQKGHMRVARFSVLAFVLVVVGCRRELEPPGACSATDSRIVVETAKHRLALCARGREAAVFDIRYGRGGVGKRAEGDRKTPIGIYDLGAPRPSNRFGTFIPIEYPTSEQRQQGFTGSDVGVHGPPRWMRWLGSLMNTFDSSDGCIGLATGVEIEAIASWVTMTQARTIEIR